MPQINLLPPEVGQAARTRRLTIVVAFAGVAVLALIIFMWVLQGFTESRLNRDLAAQNATNAQLQQQVNELQHFAALRTDLQDRQAVLSEALATTVSWSGVLRDLALVIPDRSWITTFTGSVSAQPGVVIPAAPGGTLIGTVQVQGNSLDTDTIALWLTRVEQIKGWVNAWVSAFTKTAAGSTPVWQFTSTIDLTSKAAQPGGQQ
jgi:Tfp pilus assembly protein PilN